MKIALKICYNWSYRSNIQNIYSQYIEEVDVRIEYMALQQLMFSIGLQLFTTAKDYSYLKLPES